MDKRQGSFNHYIAPFLVADLSEHISSKFAPEVTSGEVLCHTDTESAVCVCVFEQGGWGLVEEEITHMPLT